MGDVDAPLSRHLGFLLEETALTRVNQSLAAVVVRLVPGWCIAGQVQIPFPEELSATYGLSAEVCTLSASYLAVAFISLPGCAHVPDERAASASQQISAYSAHLIVYWPSTYAITRHPFVLITCSHLPDLCLIHGQATAMDRSWYSSDKLSEFRGLSTERGTLTQSRLFDSLKHNDSIAFATWHDCRFTALSCQSLHHSVLYLPSLFS